MDITTAIPAIDATVVVIANLINLGMIAIFLARARGRRRLEWGIGLAQIALVIPLGAVIGLNAAGGRGWWWIALPAVPVAFLLLELLLDYILRLNFRETWLLGPYLLLYYTALWSLLGYAFLASSTAGFVTLATYFAQLGATAYSYRQVGHGARPEGARNA